MPRLAIVPLMNGAEQAVVLAFTPVSAVDGMKVNASETEDLTFLFRNDGAAPVTVTMKAGDNTAIAWRRTVGDRVVNVPASSIVSFQGAESARYKQSDGTLYLDVSAALSVAVLRR